MGRQHSLEYVEYLDSPEWKAFRAAALKHAGYRCQRCGRARLPSKLHVHHIDYESLGQETFADVRVVCADTCHPLEDEDRADETRQRVYNARLEGWARKVYGEDWEEVEDPDEVEEAFDAWLERRGYA